MYKKPSEAGDLFPGKSSSSSKTKEKNQESKGEGSEKSKDKGSEKSEDKKSDKSSAAGENSSQSKSYDYWSHSWYSRLLLIFVLCFALFCVFYAALTMIYKGLKLHRTNWSLSHFMPLFPSHCGSGMTNHTCTSDLKTVP